MIFPCNKCYEFGQICPACKEKNKKPLDRLKLLQKIKKDIRAGKQKTL